MAKGRSRRMEEILAEEAEEAVEKTVEQDEC